jgi:hypothetical protein
MPYAMLRLLRRKWIDSKLMLKRVCTQGRLWLSLSINKLVLFPDLIQIVN